MIFSPFGAETWTAWTIMKTESKYYWIEMLQTFRMVFGGNSAWGQSSITDLKHIPYVSNIPKKNPRILSRSITEGLHDIYRPQAVDDSKVEVVDSVPRWFRVHFNKLRQMSCNSGPLLFIRQTPDHNQGQFRAECNVFRKSEKKLSPETWTWSQGEQWQYLASKPLVMHEHNHVTFQRYTWTWNMTWTWMLGSYFFYIVPSFLPPLWSVFIALGLRD